MTYLFFFFSSTFRSWWPVAIPWFATGISRLFFEIGIGVLVVSCMIYTNDSWINSWPKTSIFVDALLIAFSVGLVLAWFVRLVEKNLRYIACYFLLYFHRNLEILVRRYLHPEFVVYNTGHRSRPICTFHHEEFEKCQTSAIPLIRFMNSASWFGATRCYS